MKRNKTVLLFVAKAVVIYGILILPLSFIDGQYGSAYRTLGNLFFHRVRGTGMVMFSEGQERFMTRIIMGNPAQAGPDGRTRVVKDDVNVRQQLSMHVAALLALILASPVPWRRRAAAVLPGLIALTAFVMFKLWLHILVQCEFYTFLGLYAPTPFWKTVLETSHDVLYAMIYPTLFFVVAIWLVTTVRKGDVQTIAAG